MSLAPSPRDLLACLHVRQQDLLSDAELESAVQEWLKGPARPLLDALVERARIPAGQLTLLKSTIDRRAQETCAEPLAVRIRALPNGVQRLLAMASGEAPPTERSGDTRAESAIRRLPAATTAGMTPGDRFEVQQVLAQGGLGVVFLARDREIDRTVALKQIKSQWADDEDSRARFLLEARVTGRLEHPGVAPVYALGADDTGRPYYAMRLIRGDSLLEVIDRFHRDRDVERNHAKRMSELRKLLQRFLDVCNAVDYAHSKGVIHRDIKPSNIMLGKYGETLTVDWGLAKVIGSDEDVALTTRMAPTTHDDDGGAMSTRLGTAIGTPAYMSPEQAAGRINELGPATDVYSLGATLFHLLTGNLPHPAEEDVGVMIAQAEHGPTIRPRQFVPWLPRPLESICLKALAPQPTARYISARALSDDIQRWLADEPVQAHAERWTERTFRWLRNHRTLATALVVAYLVATLAAAIGAFGLSRIREARSEGRDAAPVRSTAP
jgi:eukaryotic-like serine/threonine-protein kinase